MEASSHGLAQYRLDGVRLAAAGFTNLTRDHLDYHPTFEDYFAAKMRLFSELLPEGAAAVINADHRDRQGRGGARPRPWAQNIHRGREGRWTQARLERARRLRPAAGARDRERSA